jgi:mannose-1-phosphate guanylyltransferase/mannose-6-phosphate isomerase
MIDIHPVILSGGTGTRLWPVSRANHPKQFLSLPGPHSMIQETALRAALPNASAPIVICAADHRFRVGEQLQSVGIAPDTIVLEPQGRKTAAAAAIAALLVAERNSDGVVLLLPSDHAVADRDAFAAAVRKAAAAAAKGFVVTLGVAAKTAETGFGYIRKGEAIAGVRDAYAVKQFVEKPDHATAENLIAAGDFLWNSGVFVFRPETLLAEMAEHAPAVLQACRAALSLGERSTDFIRLEARAFGNAPDISLDHAVMERTRRAVVVSSTMKWADIGAWSSVWDLAERDSDGNAFHGDVVAHDVLRSLVRSETTLVALVGVHDLVVIATDDAVLVADIARAQDVGSIADLLKSAGRVEATEHKTVTRPWGTYRAIDGGSGFQVKHIVVKPGGRLSLQMHHKRAEHWIVVAGIARVTCDEKTFDLRANQSTFIPLGAKHRLENLGDEPLHLIEVQCGSYLGEDDIVRFEDVYGRAPDASKTP